MMQAIDTANAIRARRISAVAIVRETLEHIERANPALNCFTAVLAERALADAAMIDARVAAGHEMGPLSGVPFAVKNLFDIEGVTTRAGSKILRDNPPATRDATAIRRLREAGAVLIGALNMDEFAYGFVTENAHDGPTRNPHATDRIAGGSSGGSAAAVAAGLVPITLGSDTNGSIRVPAALCGVYGLKPTFGRLSRAGTFPFVPDLDHIGPFARNVTDLAAIYDVLQGPDPSDPACTARPVHASLPTLEDAPRQLRIGVLRGWFAQGATDAALAALEIVARAFPSVRTIDLPGVQSARSAAFCLTASQGAELHRENLRLRPFDFDPSTRDRLLAGLLVPATALSAARRIRRHFQDEMRKTFDIVDVLLAPCTPFPAPRIGQTVETIRGHDVPIRANLGLYTQPISFVGLPVVAVPVTVPGHLPLGVQIIGPAYGEARTLRVARRLEREGVVGAWPVPGPAAC
jgi:aspartyl-tRNA(Asn)/glutamyl-tRNA(Gln) amidotransferase subunit A